MFLAEDSERNGIINTLVIKTDGRNISLSGGSLPTSNSKNYDRCMFMPGEEWRNFSKSAVFWQESDERYEVPLDESDSCDIPWEVQQKDGFMFVGLIGRNDDCVIASKVLIVPINEGVQAGSAEASVTQPLYDMLIAQCGEYADSAKTYSQAALDAAAHFPYIGDNGHWYIWDTSSSAYKDSGQEVETSIDISGYMATSVYDKDGDGIADNATALGGIAAGQYATITYLKEYVDSKINSALEESY